MDDVVYSVFGEELIQELRCEVIGYTCMAEAALSHTAQLTLGGTLQSMVSTDHVKLQAGSSRQKGGGCSPTPHAGQSSTTIAPIPPHHVQMRLQSAVCKLCCADVLPAPRFLTDLTKSCGA